MMDNLIVDGTQLAIRCSDAPGLGDLTDSKGRPTGAIIGFLKCLSSYRRKFEPSAVYVCWDGSSQRRRKMFPGYKSNRSRVPLTFEVERLQEILPLCGIVQVTNPEEEADDLIATLVRGKLKWQKNVFVSTDRDLCQLVTETDLQFVPSVGGGSEKILDIEGVGNEFWVRPGEVVQVRALAGDSSDTVPGAEGVGVKTAANLIGLYGTVEGVLKSNLAGIGKKKAANIRAVSKQILLNLDILKLYCDIPLTVTEANPDQNAAAERLRDVDIKPETLLPAYFGQLDGTN